MLLDRFHLNISVKKLIFCLIIISLFCQYINFINYIFLCFLLFVTSYSILKQNWSIFFLVSLGFSPFYIGAVNIYSYKLIYFLILILIFKILFVSKFERKLGFNIILTVIPLLIYSLIMNYENYNILIKNLLLLGISLVLVFLKIENKKDLEKELIHLGIIILLIDNIMIYFNFGVSNVVFSETAEIIYGLYNPWLPFVIYFFL